MKDPRSIRNLFWAVAVTAVFVSVQPMALSAQTKPAPAGGTFNLTKEVSDKKGAIVWKDAPSDAIPREVCTILTACGGQNKLIALPAATEGGQKVGRGMFLSKSRDGKTDLIILLRQTYNDRYFYLLGPDGNLQKAAFIQLGAKSWQPIAAALVQPTFDKEKKAWHDHVLKLGAAPPAAAPQSN